MITPLRQRASSFLAGALQKINFKSEIPESGFMVRRMTMPEGPSASIQFLGGAGTVTGSKTLVEWNGQSVLVDCGLFQGLKELRLLNREPFPVDPAGIQSVLLTHAHLDHIGYLPLLVKNGFRGRIYCSPPTYELAKLLLPDTAKIQEEDADYANLMGFSRHHPALPLFQRQDAQRALKHFVPVPALGEWQSLGGGLRFRFSRSGHMLGSVFVELKIPVGPEGRIVAFSGDLGRPEPLLLRPPSRIRAADYLVVESTYGDRNHPTQPIEPRLAQVVLETIQRGGHVIVPSFVVERAQELLFLFSKLIRQRQIPEIPIFLDSPMGVSATQLFLDFPEWHNLNPQQVREFCDYVALVRSPENSGKIFARSQGTSIVVAGSGMATGGRILHHLVEGLPDPKNTILLAGFQAAGTRGRLLQEGAKRIRIHGSDVPVRARIEVVVGFSAHADQSGILHWLSGFESPPRRTFLVHGEKKASEALSRRIRARLGWSCSIPTFLDKIVLSD